jgi:DNA repair protein RecN (Recombination protein N)
LGAAGRELTAARQAVIPRLARAVATQLADLGFRQSQFGVALQPASAPTATGLDVVDFQFAPNPGEPARPLRAIASSGEMARVMLAIKTVLATEDEIPVLVFDEVDANVGGETAHAVGEKMRQIARCRQVFCVTHLAPVAAAADVHFRVAKEVRDGRTTTAMERLGDRERVTELARMLGGQSEAARKHAESLLAARAPRAR